MSESLREKSTKTKRLIYLILILLLLFIIAAIIYLFLVYYKGAPDQQVDINRVISPEPAQPIIQQDSFNTANSEVLADLEGLNNTGETNEPAEEARAVFIAKDFAERFGTYSNQSNYKNLYELEIFMTQAMSDWIPKYKEKLMAENPEIDTYYAMDTIAISTTVLNIDEDNSTAEVIVKTQRQEFKNDINNPDVFYQDILVNLVKIGNAWTIDGAFWQ